MIKHEDGRNEASDVIKMLRSLQPDMLVGVEEAETNCKDGVFTVRASKRFTVANVIECIERLTEKLEKANGMLEWTHKEVLRLNIENSELHAKLATAERERDAAIVDIRNAKWCLCHVCQNYYRPDPDVRHYECKAFGKFSDLFSPSDFEEEEHNPINMCGKFKWRGVCEENAKER